MPPVKSVTLYKTEGSSDKVYQVSILPSGDGYSVQYQNGRRGSTLKSGLKTQAPVDLDTATEIYNKVVKEKTKGGYTEDASGSVYLGTENAGRISGYRPQLLNPVEENDLQHYMNHDGWMLQEKKDGERRFLIFKDGEAMGANRDGLTVALPAGLANELLELADLEGSQEHEFVLDGEACGDDFHAFDLLVDRGEDIRHLSAEVRHQRLQRMINEHGFVYISAVESFYGEEQKRNAAAILRNENAEGFVLKDRNSKYVANRPSSLGDQLKFKFYAEATVRIEGVNTGKRSVRMQMLDGDRLVDVGNVTVPANLPIPTEGEMVDVRYLYAMPGGSLIQPVLMKARPDKSVADDLASLKMKQAAKQAPRKLGM